MEFCAICVGIGVFKKDNGHTRPERHQMGGRRLKATWAQGVKAMRNIEKLGCLVGVTAILALSVPAEARVVLNRLAANKLAGNLIAANKLAANKLAGNLIAANKLASNKLAGDGAFTDVSVIEFPNGIRFTR
jgi:hypothetical protein